MVKQIVWSFVLLLLLAAAGLVYLSMHKPDPPETSKAGVGKIERLALGGGRVEGQGEPVTLSFPRTGYLKDIYVKESQDLDPEDLVVAELDSSELDKKIAEAQESKNQLSAKLEQMTAPRPKEVLDESEAKLRQAAADVSTAQIRLQALREPSTPPAAQAYEVAEAERNIERARQKLVLEQAAWDKLKEGPSADEKAVADAIVSLARTKYDGAVELQKSSKGPSAPPIFPFNASGQRESSDQLKVNVELARAELEKAQAERDQRLRGASPFELTCAAARVALAKVEVESAEAAKKKLEKPVAPPPAPSHIIAEAEIALIQAKDREAQAKAVLDQLKRGPEPGDVKGAEAAVKQAEEALSLLKMQKEGLKLRAPFAGRVIKIFAEKGVVVNAFVPIVTLVDFSKKKVRAEFDVSKLADIKTGMKVSLRSKAFKDPSGGQAKEPLDGKVERIVSVGTRKVFADDPAATKGGEVVEVLISVDEPQNEGLKKEAYDVLLPGLRMDASITLERLDNVLCIYKSYVLNENNQEYVLKKLRDGDTSAPIKQPVKCGLRDDVFVQVSQGLADGDIIVRPQLLQTR
jgi:multidrug resistance efflux pump